jgi:hypothetical protein
MLGVLIVALGGNAVARQGCIPSQDLIFLQHLLGRAADLDLRSVALEALVLVGAMAPAVAS